ncbi:solute carrier family 2, facilitated glucose transporter member 9 [Boleophthalmus pectinirostris]|uniref:solute carrier family 2, facilitated glucose transporter member 9 n=1 Tax=Boleophthalmus pectinirostris TaxID=150288 RepID=UPI0024304434|nr:solute carrier family 2, facilitated glucose transporter member 9 [Boleophthalmus pectinirostris]
MSRCAYFCLSGLRSDLRIALSALPMYLGEISPKHMRGFIGQFNSILICLGVFTGQVLGLPELLGQESRWVFLFSFIAVPPLLQICVLPFLPESPRFLLMERRDEAAAERGKQQQVKVKLSAVRYSGRQHWGTTGLSILSLLSKSTDAISYRTETDEVVHWCEEQNLVLNVEKTKEIIFDPKSVGDHSPVNIRGRDIEQIWYYTSGILREAGFSESILPYITLSTGAVETLAAVVSSWFRGRFSRKPLLIFGFSSMSLFFSLLTVFLTFQESFSWMPYLSYVCILAVIASFCSGPGGIPFILTGELFEQSFRPAAFMIAGIVNWLSNFTVGLLFPFIQVGLVSRGIRAEVSLLKCLA